VSIAVTLFAASEIKGKMMMSSEKMVLYDRRITRIPDYNAKNKLAFLVIC
jgi:hypothetical protein